MTINQLIKDLTIQVDDKAVAAFEYEIANYYFNINHYSAAFSFFIRVSGRNIANRFKYLALLKAHLCLIKLENRDHSAKTLLLHAVSLEPNRPEAYFHLAKLSEKFKEYNECYTYSVLGLGFRENAIFEDNLEYPGEYALTYQKAFAAWWIGRAEECRLLFQSLKGKVNDPIYKQLIQNNMSRLGSTRNTFVQYNKSDYDKLKVKFLGSELIDFNYSQTYQDMFVLSMLNGKRDGLFLEIGAADPYYGSNTALLEKFGWNGISIDIKEEEIQKFHNNRKCTALVRDALSTNYKTLLKSFTDKTDIDYLQLDCEPPENTLKILMAIPFEEYRFAVITFEHDYYCDFDGTIREKSRKFLEEAGYELVVANVAPDNRGIYEDWWVHPELVDENIKNILKNDKNDVNYIKDIFLQ